MMDNIHWKPIFAFIALLGIGAVILLFVVGGKNEGTIERNNEAQVTKIEENRIAGEESSYHNGLEACERGNTIRITQYEEAVQNENHVAEKRLLNVPHVSPNGAIECIVAVKLPPSLANGGLKEPLSEPVQSSGHLR